jgi:hypothetical protein
MEDKENINFIFQLENKGQSNNYFLLFILSFVAFLGIAFYFVATNKTWELITNIVIAVAYFFVMGKIKPSFFELLVTEQQLQVNFYSVFTVARNYQSIEMDLGQLKDFKIERKFWRMRKELTLTVESRFGLADYPAVSLSTLKKADIARIEKVLSQILNNNHRA